MITLQQAQFRKAALLASSVVDRRATIPVLSTLKVTANGSLALEGTDLDAFTRASLPYEGDEGEFLLPEPGKLVKALKRAGGDTVSFSPGEKKVAVKAGDLTAEMNATMHPDDFPAVMRVTEETFGAEVGANFIRALDRVSPAMPTEETRYYLNGVYFRSVGEWQYQAIATDGHRLFIADVALPGATGELPGNVIIPRRAVERVVGAFGKSGEPVRLAIGGGVLSNERDKTLSPVSAKSRASFTGKVGEVDFSLTTKLIDGTYPDVSRVIPAGHQYALRTSRADLINALRAITPMATGKTRAVRIALQPEQMSLQIQSPDIGTTSFLVAVKHNTPEGYSFGLNARCLLDALDALTGEEVDFGLNDPLSPITITDPSDLAFKIVQMPVRV